jgi:3-oxoacyl-[acyl-carrier-protein] synthase-3
MKFKISNISYHLPANEEDLNVLKVDNSNWDISKIYEKTGINKRWISNLDETACDLAVIAANKLFDSCSVARQDVDLLIFVSQSSDYFLPTTACIIQDRLGLPKSSMAFDINLGCSGFVYALSIAGSLLDSGVANKGLILCSDTYTKFISKDDRTCRPIFSDGAAAILVEKSDIKSIGPFIFGTDGSGFDRLIVKNGGMRNYSKNNTQDITLEMNGSSVFLFTMNEIPKLINNILDKAELNIKDLDLIIFHQASKFVIDNLIEKLSLDRNKVFINYEFIGNTVSASIPIALKDACDQKRLKNGDKIMLVGFGVGLSWGATIIDWNLSK